MMGQAYDQVLTELAKSYKFIMRDVGSGVRLRMKAIDTMPLVDCLDGYMLSQDLNLLDH